MISKRGGAASTKKKGGWGLRQPTNNRDYQQDVSLGKERGWQEMSMYRKQTRGTKVAGKI